MNALNSLDYLSFVADLKVRIQAARISAARSVNRDLILLYWDIGRGIVEKQETSHWGDGVVERLAADLRAEFPDMRGFSANNLWLIRQFYSEYSTPEFLEQAVQEMKRGHWASAIQAAQGSGRGAKLMAQPVPAARNNKPDEVLEQPVQEKLSQAIGVAEYQLQPKLPAELRGKLPTARQFADAVKGEWGAPALPSR